MRRALLIGQEAETRESVVETLRAQGFECLEADDGQEGLRLASGGPAELILVDLSLRDRPAWELIRALRRIPWTSVTPIVAMSSAVMGAERARALAAGCDAFLAKPVSGEALRRLIEELSLSDGESSDPERTAPIMLAQTTLRVPSRSRVVVVSRSESFTRDLYSRLDPRRYAVAACETPAEAAAQIGDACADLVVVESWKTGGSGRGLARLRARAREAAVPVLLVGEDPAEAEAARALGADDFLPYPAESALLAPRAQLLIEFGRTARLLQTRTTELAELSRHVRRGVVLLDEAGRVTLVNPIAAEWLAALPRRILGHSSRRLFEGAALTRPDGAPYPAEENIVERLRRQDATEEREVLRVRRDGAPDAYLEAVARRIVDGRHRTRGFALLLQPLGARASDRPDLVEAYQELMQVDRLKSKFLSTVSHELRTPLNTIILLSHVLASEGDASRPVETRRKDLEIIRRSATALLHMINNLLDLARLQSGRAAPEPRPFQLAAFLGETIEIVDPQARSRGIRLTLTIAEGAPEVVDMDREKTRQILINLLSNAIKFTGEGRAVSLLAAPARREGVLRFEVRDEGPGIPADKLPLIFEPFRQIETSGNPARGSGLGLSIVRELIQLLGGQIHVESEPGRGSAFVVTLPFAQARRSQETLPGTARPLRGGERLLLVEDDPSSRYGMRQVLELEGLSAEEAGTAEEALRRAAAQRYDAVLVDISLPDMPGTDLVRRLRALPGGADVPIIAVTGLTSEEDRRLIAEAGTTAYLSKPVNIPEMMRLLRAILADRSPSPK